MFCFRLLLYCCRDVSSKISRRAETTSSSHSNKYQRQSLLGSAQSPEAATQKERSSISEGEHQAGDRLVRHAVCQAHSQIRFQPRQRVQTPVHASVVMATAEYD